MDFFQENIPGSKFQLVDYFKYQKLKIEKNKC